MLWSPSFRFFSYAKKHNTISFCCYPPWPNWPFDTLCFHFDTQPVPFVVPWQRYDSPQGHSTITSQPARYVRFLPRNFSKIIDHVLVSLFRYKTHYIFSGSTAPTNDGNVMEGSHPLLIFSYHTSKKKVQLWLRFEAVALALSDITSFQCAICASFAHSSVLCDWWDWLL